MAFSALTENAQRQNKGKNKNSCYRIFGDGRSALLNG